MINNLRDLWPKSQHYKKEKLTPTLNTRSGPTHEKTINLKSTKMDSLNSSSSWQTIKVALIEALKSTPLLEPVGRFFENNEIELAKEYCADTTKVSTYANHAAISYVLSKLTTHFPLINQTELSRYKSIGDLVLHLEQVINSKSDQLMSVTHSLQKFLRVQYNANKPNALGSFMSDYQHAWNTLYNEAKHLTYDPPYVLPWQIQFAPILTNLVHMNVDDISTGHHAKIVSAGNDSELAKNACVEIRDKLSQIARTRNLHDSARSPSGNVLRRTKNNVPTVISLFGKKWHQRARKCAQYNTYPSGFQKLPPDEKEIFLNKYQEFGGKLLDDLKNPAKKQRRVVEVPADEYEELKKNSKNVSCVLE